MLKQISKVAKFYINGFREMTVGRTLWLIILIKLFIMFAILRIFFFPNILGGKSNEEKADYVIENMIQKP